MRHGHSACWRSREHPDSTDLDKHDVLCDQMVKAAMLRSLKDMRCVVSYAVVSMGRFLRVRAAVMVELLGRH